VAGLGQQALRCAKSANWSSLQLLAGMAWLQHGY
jgi:hypothetical protein